MNIQEKLLTVNQYSRPGTKRNSTTKIAVHYVANPGTSAIANRNYFENCKTTGVYVSSNYIVGLDGEVIRCVPDDEIAYCTNQANAYSISIETCHPDWTGKFNPKTYASLVELCTLLLKKYKLESDDLIRHFDVTGKVCPKCFVEASKGGSDDEKNSAWNKFKSDVKAKMNGNTSSPGTSQLYRVRKSWADVKSQIGAFSSLDNAKKACKPGFSVFDSGGKKVFPEEAKSAEKPTPEGSFLVRVTSDSLFIRSAPGLDSKVNGTVSKNEVFTIVDTAMVGTVQWGKLKSGAGWISLSPKYAEKI